MRWSWCRTGENEGRGPVSGSVVETGSRGPDGERRVVITSIIGSRIEGSRHAPPDARHHIAPCRASAHPQRC